MTYQPTLDHIRRAPKVLLHDHLDGGLRPGTITELARDVGYRDLPTADAGELAEWFTQIAHSGSLERYLESFKHTVAVMQTQEGLSRVAAECAEDLAADGVVYAEVRFAPELHITAIRHAARSMEIAELVVRYRDAGVAGFDIAGPEAGYPPTRHLDAFEYLQRENAHFTIHAGEGFGLPSIWQAIQWCGADRLGHGVRIIDDIAENSGSAVPKLGRLAAYVRDKRIPLEMCPTSNVHTGAARSVAEHPIGLLRRLYFRVTVNTDNRLMSATSLSAEFARLVEAFGYGWDDLQWFTINAMKSAFLPFDERLELINGVIKPGFAQLKWRGSKPLA